MQKNYYEASGLKKYFATKDDRFLKKKEFKEWLRLGTPLPIGDTFHPPYALKFWNEVHLYQNLERFEIQTDKNYGSLNKAVRVVFVLSYSFGYELDFSIRFSPRKTFTRVTVNFKGGRYTTSEDEARGIVKTDTPSTLFGGDLKRLSTAITNNTDYIGWVPLGFLLQETGYYNATGVKYQCKTGEVYKRQQVMPSLKRFSLFISKVAKAIGSPLRLSAKGKVTPVTNKTFLPPLRKGNLLALDDSHIPASHFALFLSSMPRAQIPSLLNPSLYSLRVNASAAPFIKEILKRWRPDPTLTKKTIDQVVYPIGCWVRTNYNHFGRIISFSKKNYRVAQIVTAEHQPTRHHTKNIDLFSQKSYYFIPSPIDQSKILASPREILAKKRITAIEKEFLVALGKQYSLGTLSYGEYREVAFDGRGRETGVRLWPENPRAYRVLFLKTKKALCLVYRVNYSCFLVDIELALETKGKAISVTPEMQVRFMTKGYRPSVTPNCPYYLKERLGWWKGKPISSTDLSDGIVKALDGCTKEVEKKTNYLEHPELIGGVPVWSIFHKAVLKSNKPTATIANLPRNEWKKFLIRLFKTLFPQPQSGKKGLTYRDFGFRVNSHSPWSESVLINPKTKEAALALRTIFEWAGPDEWAFEQKKESIMALTAYEFNTSLYSYSVVKCNYIDHFRAELIAYLDKTL